MSPDPESDTDEVDEDDHPGPSFLDYVEDTCGLFDPTDFSRPHSTASSVVSKWLRLAGEALLRSRDAIPGRWTWATWAWLMRDDEPGRRVMFAVESLAAAEGAPKDASIGLTVATIAVCKVGDEIERDVQRPMIAKILASPETPDAVRDAAQSAFDEDEDAIRKLRRALRPASTLPAKEVSPSAPSKEVPDTPSEIAVPVAAPADPTPEVGVPAPESATEVPDTVPAIRWTENLFGILELIIERGPIQGVAIAELLSIGRRTVSRSVAQLRPHEVVETRGRSGYAVPDGRRQKARSLLAKGRKAVGL